MCEELKSLKQVEAKAIKEHHRALQAMEDVLLKPVGTEQAIQWWALKERADEAMRKRVAAHDRVRQHRAKHPCY
jgi:hypothetical protein